MGGLGATRWEVLARVLGYLAGGHGAMRCCEKLAPSSTGMASTFAVLVVAGFAAFNWQQRSKLEKDIRC